VPLWSKSQKVVSYHQLSYKTQEINRISAALEASIDMMRESPNLRLSVWRPVRWSGRYLDVVKGKPADMSLFHEQIYSWEMQESPFDGIENAEKAESMRTALFDGFGLEKSPSQRGIEVLENVLSLLDGMLAGGASSWTDSTQEQELPDKQQSPVCIRQQRLLALRCRLKWICDTFRDVPKASITLR